MRAHPTRGACTALALAVLGACASSDEGPQVPEGWVEVYSQDFEGERFGLDFVLSDPDAWRVGEEDDNRFLEQHAQSAYAPPHRSPLNVAVLAGPYVGDFVLEVDVMQTGREYDHRDACVFFAVQDPAHLAYAHLATAADENAHHVQLVAGGDRAPITRRRSFGVDWGRDVWHRVRVEHSRSFDRVRVYLDGGPDPVLEARAALSSGWVGLGTFDDSARFDNLVVYAPALDIRSPDFFQPLGER